MDRRDFLKSSALIAATQVAPVESIASTFAPKAEEAKEKSDKLIDSAPMLQNFAETSIGIAFSVTALANGYVVYGEQPDLSDGRKVYCGGYKLTDMNDQCMLIRLTGLKPATKYYYRIGADRIHYGGGYDMKITGNEEPPTIYSFRTAGQKGGSHFCVINDTHAKWDAFGLAINKIEQLQPDCVVWNGDACNTEETVAAQKRIFLYPAIDKKDYAARIPYLFCPGNHDDRGLANRHLERIWMLRQPEERSPRDWDLGRNFAVRMGDVAIIGLDTAEDKLDTNPIFANLFNSEAYRKAQVEWLRDALKRKDIASAPFLVAFCHIPLFDPTPRSNPGDLAPADVHPDYDLQWAAWQRTCARLWTPLLEKAKCQLIITAHQHVCKYYAATKERPWAEIIGGGPDTKSSRKELFPTVIEGDVRDGKLNIRIHNVLNNSIVGDYTFSRR